MTVDRPHPLAVGSPAPGCVDTSAAAGRERFLDLYNEHRGHLFGHIMALAGQLDLAHEVFQETSLVLWREFDRFQPDTNFRAWARAIALNCLRAVRRKRQPIVLDDELLQQIADERSRMDERLEERWRHLQDCLSRLRPEDAKLVDEYYGDGATADTVAVRRGLSVHAIRKTIKRIRKALFACVDRDKPA